MSADVLISAHLHRNRLLFEYEDGFHRSVPVSKFPFFRRDPPLRPETVQVISEGLAVSFLDIQDNSVEISSIVIRKKLNPRNTYIKDLASRPPGEEIGRRLRQAMKKRRVTIKEVSKRARMSETYIRDILYGRAWLSPKILKRFGVGIGANYYELIYEIGLLSI